MRIIGGKLGGLRLNPPNLPSVRPTTDVAKEALFGVLGNRMDLEGADCLDLFAGTGGISFELASRGARSVVAVDIASKCVRYISETCKRFGISEIEPKKSDAFRFVRSAVVDCDLIFADPPYDLPELPGLANRMLERGLLRPGGTMVIEHPAMRKMDVSPYFTEARKYGYSSFSFYTLPKPL